VQAVSNPPTSWVRRATPVACGCVMVGAAALVALNDPSAPGSRFPACQFRALTGLWCPGCGLTRGFHELFTGHPFAALGFNLFVPMVLVGVLAAYWSWARRCWGRAPLRRPAWTIPFLTWVLPAMLIVYGVLRNIPAAPFDALAP
jgi:hypothetical protein